MDVSILEVSTFNYFPFVFAFLKNHLKVILYRIISRSKRTIKNRWRIEGAMRETYLAREISNFDSYYFENYVSCLRNRPNRHDDGGIIDPLAPPLSVFNHPGKGGSKHARKRMLTEMELKSASTHVLLNCPELFCWYIWER